MQYANEVQHGLQLGEIDFAVEADAELVVELYTDIFVRSFDTFAQCDCLAHVEYNHFGWGAGEFRSLMGALKFMEA